VQLLGRRLVRGQLADPGIEDEPAGGDPLRQVVELNPKCHVFLPMLVVENGRSLRTAGR
jgi:hypothetical protein